MGCCHSRSSGRRAAPDTAARAGIHPVVQTNSHGDFPRAAAVDPSPSSSDSLRQQQPAPQQHSAYPPPPAPAHHHGPHSSSSRPNQPIRAPSPVAKSPKNVSRCAPPWTRRHLERERQAFFDTRVTGRAEVWSALRLVCEVLRAGEVQQAQGILDAANLSCPTGRVAKGRASSHHGGGGGGGGRGDRGPKGGVYDERGELYELPDWVVSDPRDVVEDATVSADEEDKDVDAGAEEDDDDDESDGAVVKARRQQQQQQQARKDAKGKGRAADVGDELRVRCRLSHSARDIDVGLGSRQAAGLLVAKLQEQIGERRLKLVYLGRPLDVARTLDAQGWQVGHIINALVLD